MSLKPKRVDFDTTWASLKETVKGVITFSNVQSLIDAKLLTSNTEVIIIKMT